MSVLRRLDRYVISETVGPLALGFSIYTFIMLVRFLFRSADMIIRRGLSAGEVGQLVLYTLPNIVVLTIPMALLFAILIAIGRLASDSELVAMRACGISLFTLYRPILLLSALLTVVNVYVSAYVLPRANHALQVQTLEIFAKTAARQVEPRVFYEEWEGLVLYVFAIEPGTDLWQGVFLAPSVQQAQNTVTVAKRGRLQVDEAGENIVLHLEEALSHKVDLDRPEIGRAGPKTIRSLASRGSPPSTAPREGRARRPPRPARDRPYRTSDKIDYVNLPRDAAGWT